MSTNKKAEFGYLDVTKKETFQQDASLFGISQEI